MTVHRTTITRHLKKRGIKARRAARKLPLHANHIRIRYDFAETYDNLGADYWTGATIYSDESSPG